MSINLIMFFDRVFSFCCLNSSNLFQIFLSKYIECFIKQLLYKIANKFRVIKDEKRYLKCDKILFKLSEQSYMSDKIGFRSNQYFQANCEKIDRKFILTEMWLPNIK